MKKLLLVTGIFLSLGLMVSAQQKKTTVAVTTTQTPQKKKTIKDAQTSQTDLKAEKTAEKMKRAEAKKKHASSPASKDTQSN